MLCNIKVKKLPEYVIFKAVFQNENERYYTFT